MVGETIAHYKIIDKLGQGGMGEVFLAEDTKLDRKVALKFLPDSLHQDPVAEKRFLREAKSAAALDHPFICHVHEVGEDNGKSFISMEYVSGENLKDRLAKGPLPLKEALEIATEIAEALETAHKANIVHRDLKPSNIMLTPDGHVKVMDFGLAKQLVAAGGVGSQEQTGTAGLTETGMTLGTLTYMSPEQLRGRTVDTRSDIFSFGIVLYEMLTDIHPFKKPEPMETASSILIDDPPPLSQYLNGVSPVLEHTVRKMLAKNPDQRYQATREVKIDLEAPMGESGFSFPAGSQVSVVKYAAGLGLVLAFGAAIWLYLGSTPSDSPLPPPKVSMFAGYPGQKRYPDISPDGRQITFAWEGQTGGNFDIYVKLVGAGRPLQLTTHPGDDLHPTWSPDGQHIAFLRRDGGDGGVFIVPSLGGSEKKLLGEDFAFYSGGLDWSPDGRFLAFIGEREPQSPMPRSLHLLSLESLETRRLTFPPSQMRDLVPRFSPQGDTLAFTRLSAAGVNDLYVVSMAGGDPQRLTFDNRLIGGRGWTPDGEEIVFSSNRGGNFRLWRVPAQGGEPKPLAIGGENAQNLSISQEGHLLAYTQRLVDENLWRMSGPRSPVKTGPTQLVALTQRTTEVDYDPEGDRIAFVAGYGVHSDIWVGDSDGSNLVQLTTLGRFTGRPCWSPDGREIVFTSRPEEHSNLYVVDVQTGQVRQLTSDPVNDRRPSWSRDGKSIYFGSDRSGSAQIWKIPSQGGQAAQVTQNGGWLAFESPDGKLLHYSKVGLGVYRIALGGGQEEKIELPPGAGDFWIWEGSILYERDRSLELLDLSTNKTTLLGTTDRDPDNPRISPDGRWISYSQIDQSKADIMLVENFR